MFSIITSNRKSKTKFNAIPQDDNLKKKKKKSKHAYENF